MDTLEEIREFLAETLKTLESGVKLLLQTRKTTPIDATPRQKEAVVLGNGPSLTSTISEKKDWLQDKSKFAVNFMANSPEFIGLKPDFYVLADPHFFQHFSSDKKVSALWDNLRRVDWQMTLYVPVKYAFVAKDLLSTNTFINIKTYNLTPVEGFTWFTHLCYDKGYGMPRPRNVLIPALMLAIRERFNTIYIAGADHSWSKSIWVDDDNYVVSVQPHFYPDDQEELNRVREEYKGVHLHDIFGSFAVALRSYFHIKDYADSKGVRIYNITPGSFIDAFPRLKP